MSVAYKPGMSDQQQLPADAWRPANNGTETVFTSRSGVRLLYCWQPSTGKHAYLNVDTDIILTDDEAAALLAV